MPPMSDALPPLIRALLDPRCYPHAAPLIEWVGELSAQCSMPELNGAAIDLPALAEDASRQWTGKLNPRPLQPADFVSLYRSALGLHASS